MKNVNLLIAVIVIFLGCTEDKPEPVDAFLDQNIQGLIDDENWQFVQGRATSIEEMDETLFIELAAYNFDEECHSDLITGNKVYFVVDSVVSKINLNADGGFGGQHKKGIIWAEEGRARTAVMLSIGKLEVTSISKDEISGRVYARSSTFTDTWVNGKFTVPYCAN